MQEAKAKLSSHRQSPRKTRMVVDLVRGKRVAEALSILAFTPKRSAEPVERLIKSAVSNAKELSLPVENLVIKEIKVDAGSILYRRRPRSRGMANPIRKRTSQISVTLTEGKPKKIKAKSKKLEAKS